MLGGQVVLQLKDLRGKGGGGGEGGVGEGKRNELLTKKKLHTHTPKNTHLCQHVLIKHWPKGPF